MEKWSSSLESLGIVILDFRVWIVDFGLKSRNQVKG